VGVGLPSMRDGGRYLYDDKTVSNNVGRLSCTLLYIWLQCKARRYGMYEVKLSSKNQIVIPREARDALGVKAGHKILIVVRGDTAILLRKPGKYSKSISGIGKGLYQPAYVEKERESWK